MIKKKLALLVSYIILLSIYVYAVSPIINPIYKSGYIFIIVNILIILFIILHDKIYDYKIKKIFIGIGIIAILIFLILSLVSSPIINSEKYQNLIGTVSSYDYNTKLPDIDSDVYPVVDYELAQKLGDKVLGKEVGLGSQFTIGDYYLISTQDDIAWVAPLEPQNFFKWIQNKNSIPGYIYVSATNPNDVKLVQEINGEKINIKYTQNSYFNNNINRYTYLNNNFTKGLTDFSFEIDDAGRPYWVVSKYAPTIGFSGNDIIGVATIDAQTGEVKNYSIDDKIPSWIDRIYPKSMLEQQLTYYGYYTNGWFNTVTSQKGMIKPTQGTSYVIKDGRPYLYSGMTSIKSDESTVGFMIIDLRTKKSEFYKLNGATEDAAKKSAEGKVQQYSYTSSNPILLNLYNKPTYFSTLKDDNGLVKQYAFISVENYNIVGIGETPEKAKLDYYNQLKENKLITNQVVESKIEGEVERINYIDNSFYLKIKNNKNIYVIEKDISDKLILTEPGDKISMDIVDENVVQSFENNSF